MFSFKMSEPDELKDLKAWYRTREGKPLYQLQIEMCRWAITKIKSFNDVSDHQKTVFIEKVEKQIQILAMTKRPVLGNRWGSECYSFIGSSRAKKYREKYSNEQPKERK